MNMNKSKSNETKVAAKPAVKKTRAPRKPVAKPAVKAEVEAAVSPDTLMSENSYLSIKLAETKVEKDNIAYLYESSVEKANKQMAFLQEKVTLLEVENGYLGDLIKEVSDKLVKFATLWKELESKPFKRFVAVFSFIKELMGVVVEIVDKLNK
jgi:predicted nuclease with TOPRIM domain